MRIVAGCLIKKGDKFLLIHRSPTDERRPGTWECPAGRREGNETPEQNAVREAKEEVGLDVKIIKSLGKHVTVVDGIDKTFYCFLAKADGEVKVSSEHDDFKWVTKAEALAMEKFSQDTHYFLEKL